MWSPKKQGQSDVVKVNRYELRMRFYALMHRWNRHKHVGSRSPEYVVRTVDFWKRQVSNFRHFRSHFLIVFEGLICVALHIRILKEYCHYDIMGSKDFWTSNEPTVFVGWPSNRSGTEASLGRGSSTSNTIISMKNRHEAGKHKICNINARWIDHFNARRRLTCNAWKYVWPWSIINRVDSVLFTQ